MDVSLTVQGNETLLSALEAFHSTERLSGSNMYRYKPKPNPKP